MDNIHKSSACARNAPSFLKELTWQMAEKAKPELQKSAKSSMFREYDLPVLSNSALTSMLDPALLCRMHLNAMSLRCKSL